MLQRIGVHGRVFTFFVLFGIQTRDKYRFIWAPIQIDIRFQFKNEWNQWILCIQKSRLLFYRCNFKLLPYQPELRNGTLLGGVKWSPKICQIKISNKMSVSYPEKVISTLWHVSPLEQIMFRMHLLYIEVEYKGKIHNLQHWPLWKQNFCCFGFDNNSSLRRWLPPVENFGIFLL